MHISKVLVILKIKKHCMDFAHMNKDLETNNSEKN